MNDVYIIGLGLTPVREHWHLGVRELGALAVRAALRDAGIDRVDVLYAGNMLSGQLSGQANVAALIADESDLLPAETVRVETACASGGSAVRCAAAAVASGACEIAVAVGVEKMTDAPLDVVTANLATAADQDYEAGLGFSFVGMAALLMRRYMQRTGTSHDAFAPFVVNAHRNAATSEHAMFQSAVSPEQFARSPLVAPPLAVLDAAPICDGAAAVVLCRRNSVRAAHRPIHIAGSAAATDTIGLATRADLSRLSASEWSAQRAFASARLGPADMSLAEVHDAFTIMTALSLEACGFVPAGQATRFAEEGRIGLNGSLPISTFGGLKARGHPVGASGAYQIVEACLQLRGEAGPNQVAGARRALTQSIGGHGTVVVTHILEA